MATLEDENHNPIFEVDPANRDTISVDTGDINAVEPEVSPDGSHILFRGGTKQDPQSAIYVMNADGSELTQLTHPPRGGYEGDVGPDYSPTGSQIVFVRDGAIEVMNTDGSDIHELLPATTKAWRPRWSPDGRQIVFGIEIDSSATENVWLMNADGSDAKPLVKCSCFANSPSWSPDGQFIVFSFRTITGVHSLELMRPDGLARTTIWTADALDFPFDAEWRPVTAD